MPGRNNNNRKIESECEIAALSRCLATAILTQQRLCLSLLTMPVRWELGRLEEYRKSSTRDSCIPDMTINF